MNSDLVGVFVPKSLVTEFSAWLASQLRQNSPVEITLAPAAEGTEAARRTDEWSAEMIDLMVSDSDVRMRSVLKLLAERAGEWVPTADLAKVIAHKPGVHHSSTVAGTLGAFGRRISHRYNREHGITTLPFESYWSYEHHSKLNRMSKEIAQQVLAALKKHSQDSR